MEREREGGGCPGGGGILLSHNYEIFKIQIHSIASSTILMRYKLGQLLEDLKILVSLSLRVHLINR